jgi:hypothetical protein
MYRSGAALPSPPVVVVAMLLALVRAWTGLQIQQHALGRRNFIHQTLPKKQHGRDYVSTIT